MNHRKKGASGSTVKCPFNPLGSVGGYTDSVILLERGLFGAPDGLELDVDLESGF